jgi:hypothetical protein
MADMTIANESRPIHLRLALFDQGYTPVGGQHWTWYDSALSAGCLDGFLYSVFNPAMERGVGRDSSNALIGGFASIDKEWCCWFRVFDGGLDLRGRPGRYLVLIAFCTRQEARGVDATWVLRLGPFSTIAVVAAAPPPLPALPELVLQVNAPVVSTRRDMDASLRADGPLNFSGADELRAAAAACSHLPDEDHWLLLIRGDLDRPAVKVELNPAAPATSLSQFLSMQSALNEELAGRAASNPAPSTQRDPRGRRPLPRGSMGDYRGKRQTILAAISLVCVAVLIAIYLGRGSARVARSPGSVAQRARELASKGDFREAAKAADSLKSTNLNDVVKHYWIARIYALNFGAISKSNKLPKDDADEFKEKYRQEAIKELGAVTDPEMAGFLTKLSDSERELLKSADGRERVTRIELLQDPDFDAIRELPEFRVLEEGLRKSERSPGTVSGNGSKP